MIFSVISGSLWSWSVFCCCLWLCTGWMCVVQPHPPPSIDRSPTSSPYNSQSATKTDGFLFSRIQQHKTKGTEPIEGMLCNLTLARCQTQKRETREIGQTLGQTRQETTPYVIIYLSVSLSCLFTILLLQCGRRQRDFFSWPQPTVKRKNGHCCCWRGMPWMEDYLNSVV